jgi:hypothetical protein
VIALPPLLAGGVNVTVADPLPAVAFALVGAPGTVIGVTLFDAVDGALEPATFVAMTVNVYAVPFTNPVTTCEVEGVPALLSTPPAGIDVTV